MWQPGKIPKSGESAPPADKISMLEQPQQTPIPPIDAKAVQSLKRRFMAINHSRLIRTEDALRIRKQKQFLNMVPFLFHVNHPMLPGYVSDETPAGISDYSPNKQAIDMAKAYNKRFEYKRRALFNFKLFSMFLMGSSGTIAHSEKSDFDIWLCHNPNIDADGITELQKKATLIEEWAAEFDLEVHFFLMDADRFRRGEVNDLDSESSGTAQYHLLLEEFYRSSILIAGRFPIWWLIPPEYEDRYEEYLEQLIESRAISEGEYIDFGKLPIIPAEEFFGAAVWQIYKGIDSPYKSVLKLLLIEAYTDKYPEMDLLSQRYKEAVYAGERDLDELDPYIMMTSKVEEYLRSRNEESRLELARRCFYFKVKQNLSTPDHSREKHWRRELMEKLTRAWGWDQTYLLTLDYRPTWKFHRVNEERKTLIDELTHSYKVLSNFARENAGLAMISQRDLNILGRKLYAAFERKAGKIDIINHDISANLFETHLSIHHVRNSGKNSWMVYSGTIKPEKIKQVTPLKRARSLVELIAWSHFNNLMDKGTNIALNAPGSILDSKEMYQIISVFQKQFPAGSIKGSETSDYNNAARITNCIIFVNVGVDPLSGKSLEGKHIISDKSDSLSYGNVSENIAVTFDQTLITSWGEILTNRFIGSSALMDCLSNFLRWNAPGQEIKTPTIDTFSFSSYRGSPIAARIKQLYNDIIACYYSPKTQPATRYILTIGRDYYVMQYADGTPQSSKIATYPALLKYLSLPQRHFSPVVIDRFSLSNTLLPLIYKNNRQAVIQFFFRVSGANVDIYILDEMGSLFHHNTAFFSREALLHQYNLFFNSVLNRKNTLFSGPVENADLLAGIEFYQIINDEQGQLRLDRQPVHNRGVSNDNLSVQVLGDHAEDGSESFTVFCDDKEFSMLEYGENIYSEVAKYVLRKRSGREHYPIYITDLDLSPSMLGVDSTDIIQTQHFLKYKKEIEDKLYHAVKNS